MRVGNSVKQANDIWATLQNRHELDLLVHLLKHNLNSKFGFISRVGDKFLYDSLLTVAHINCFIHNACSSATNFQVYAFFILENSIV